MSVLALVGNHVIDVPDEFRGIVIEKLSHRKGELVEVTPKSVRVHKAILGFEDRKKANRSS